VLAQQALAPVDPRCEELLDALLTRRAKDVPTTLLRSLAAVADASEALEIPLPARPTPPKLREMLRALCDEPSVALRHTPILGAVEALVDALEGGKGAVSSAGAALISHQKLLQHTASDAGVAAAFSELITLTARSLSVAKPVRTAAGAGAAASPTRAAAGATSPPPLGTQPLGTQPLGVPELLPLCAMVYSLAGMSAVSSAALGEQEQRLREGLLQACLRDPHAGGLLAPGTAPVPIEALTPTEIGSRREALDGALRVVFQRLHALATARHGLGTVTETLLLGAGQTAGEVYRPLVRHTLGMQVLTTAPPSP
jgi:hypothetical protein